MECGNAEMALIHMEVASIANVTGALVAGEPVRRARAVADATGSNGAGRWDSDGSSHQEVRRDNGAMVDSGMREISKAASWCCGSRHRGCQ